MALYYDDDAKTFAVSPDHCPNCDDGEQDLYTARNDTGCDAPGCAAARYDCCGTGCDSGLPGSRCDAAADTESAEERDGRINRERAAFGLGEAGA